VSVTAVAIARLSFDGRQMPVEHVVPAAQAMPQPPQCMLFVRGSTQDPPQGIWPPVQLDAMHIPMTHVGVPPLQMLPHEPQFIESTFVSVHMPPQSMVGDGQVHEPPAHVWPIGHALPQLPQFAPSVIVSTHAPPQSIRPDAQPHVPAAHT
jgi:hypothetical protein